MLRQRSGLSQLDFNQQVRGSNPLRNTRSDLRKAPQIIGQIDRFSICRVEFNSPQGYKMLQCWNWFTRPPQKRLSKDMEVRLLLPVLDTIEVQMDERCPAKAEVVGPNPAGGAKICQVLGHRRASKTCRPGFDSPDSMQILEWLSGNSGSLIKSVTRRSESFLQYKLWIKTT